LRRQLIVARPDLPVEREIADSFGRDGGEQRARGVMTGARWI